MPTRRKPTTSRTSSGFSTPSVEFEEEVIVTEVPEMEEAAEVQKPELLVAEAPQEAFTSQSSEPLPIPVDFAPKAQVKSPKVIKHPRNQPRFSPHR